MNSIKKLLTLVVATLALATVFNPMTASAAPDNEWAMDGGGNPFAHLKEKMVSRWSHGHPAVYPMPIVTRDCAEQRAREGYDIIEYRCSSMAPGSEGGSDDVDTNDGRPGGHHGGGHHGGGHHGGGGKKG